MDMAGMQSKFLGSAVAVAVLAVGSWLYSPSGYSVDITHYACSSGGGQRSFSEIPKGLNCFPLPRETGWTDLISTSDFIVSYHRSSAVRDRDTVKAWFQIYLAS